MAHPAESRPSGTLREAMDAGAGGAIRHRRRRQSTLGPRRFGERLLECSRRLPHDTEDQSREIMPDHLVARPSAQCDGAIEWLS